MVAGQTAQYGSLTSHLARHVTASSTYETFDPDSREGGHLRGGLKKDRRCRSKKIEPKMTKRGAITYKEGRRGQEKRSRPRKNGKARKSSCRMRNLRKDRPIFRSRETNFRRGSLDILNSKTRSGFFFFWPPPRGEIIVFCRVRAGCSVLLRKDH